jgi:hypothetical protein
MNLLHLIGDLAPKPYLVTVRIDLLAFLESLKKATGREE